jgi:hypothetical protein
VHANGFILLEVLVLMSLIATSWITLGDTHQALGLRFMREQEKRIQIKQELDQHEITQSILARQNSPSPKSFLNESSRVSRRHSYLPHSTGTIIKK